MLSPGFPLLDLVVPLIDEIRSSHISSEKRASLKAQVLSFIEGKLDYQALINSIGNYMEVIKEVSRIKSIMDTQRHPIPKEVAKYQNIKGGNFASPRTKTKHWSNYEDCRLLMGIRLFGLDNWNLVAKYVGNGRLRSQCIQRWSRELDPRLSKKMWSEEEEEKLISLVYKYNDKSWTKIAYEMGNRSDVQCRYKYIQLCRANRIKIPIQKKENKISRALLILPKNDQQQSLPKQTNSEPNFNQFFSNMTNEAPQTQLFVKQEENQNENKSTDLLFNQAVDRAISNAVNECESYGFCRMFPTDDVSFTFNDYGQKQFFG